MIDKLAAIQDKYYLLEEQLSDPELHTDQQRFRKVNKEYKDLGQIMREYESYLKIHSALETAQEMINDNDPAFQELGRSEAEELNVRLEEQVQKLKLMLIPQDPDDSKDVLFEIRSGTGGDEAAIFAGDLFRMYTRFFDLEGWNYEILEVIPEVIAN